MNPFVLFLVTICCYCTLSSLASRVTLPGHVPRITNKDVTLEGRHSSLLPLDLEHRLEKVRKLGIQWLLSQATEDYGWSASDDTARVVVALASSVEDWPAQNDLVARLIVKQLEIELLEKILRREIESLTPAKVAMYALAVGASCRDPHNFYGHNLIVSLDKHHNDQDDFPGYPETFGYSFTSLVSCLAGSHLHKRRTKHLLQISKEYKSSATPFYIDTRGIALMALQCIRHRKKGEILAHHIHEPLEAIALQQEKDGSFGNVHTTAIAIQTLAASADSALPHHSWNMTSAALALENSQEPNGSWDPNYKLNGSRHGSSTSTIVAATAESVVAISALLNGLGVLGLTRGRCNSIRRRRKHSNATSILSFNTFVTSDSLLHQHAKGDELSKDEINYFTTQKVTKETIHAQPNATNIFFTTASTKKIISTTTNEYTTTRTTTASATDLDLVRVQYWLWIGPHPITAIKHNLILQVPANSTFYFVMQRAAELVPEYEFSSKLWPTGHYVDAIAAQHEPPLGSNYWVLYLLRTDPDPKTPPENNFVAPAGVDDLRVEQNQVYLFWYKAL